MSQIIIMATIIIYLAAVVYIGVLCSKKNDAVDDFYLGGRKLGPFVTAMSAEASDMSSWLLMGLPGSAYLTGVADAAWTAIGLAIGTYVNWLIVAKRIRKYIQSVHIIPFIISYPECTLFLNTVCIKKEIAVHYTQPSLYSLAII